MLSLGQGGPFNILKMRHLRSNIRQKCGIRDQKCGKNAAFFTTYKIRLKYAQITLFFIFLNCFNLFDQFWVGNKEIICFITNKIRI